jgi:hypothetical protein
VTDAQEGGRELQVKCMLELDWWLGPAAELPNLLSTGGGAVKIPGRADLGSLVAFSSLERTESGYLPRVTIGQLRGRGLKRRAEIRCAVGDRVCGGGLK